MQNNPLVSVVIPFYDHIDWLIEAVESVLSQSYSNIEIVVVNDGSKEDVHDFLNKYENRIKYIYKENGGPASARNIGVEIAKGEYIAFLDSDDLWLPNKLELQIQEMERFNAVWSCSDYQNFGQDESIIPMIAGQEKPILIDYEPDRIATPTVVIQASVLQPNKRLRFNKEMRFGQDAYLWMQIIADYKLLVLPSVLVKVRIRGNNAGKRAYVQLTARAKLWSCRKENPEKLIKPQNFSFFYKIANEMCCISSRIVQNNFMNKHQTFREYLSRALYFIPYVIFKTNKSKIRR